MRKEPLYRKVNTKARYVRHRFGGEARYDRKTKAGISKSMKQGVERGLDYTPLYRFLLSKVGQDFNTVYSEAVSRLDNEEPIFHLVARNVKEKQDYVGCGESSYYSGLYIDDSGLLQIVNPNFKAEHLPIYCSCCTHTFNGKPVPRSFKPND